MGALFFLLSHRELGIKSVLRGLLGDSAGRNHHRHVILRLFRQSAGDAVVIGVRSLLAAGLFAHDASDAILTGVVGSRRQVPRTKTVVEI